MPRLQRIIVNAEFDRAPRRSGSAQTFGGRAPARPQCKRGVESLQVTRRILFPEPKDFHTDGRRINAVGEGVALLGSLGSFRRETPPDPRPRVLQTFGWGRPLTISERACGRRTSTARAALGSRRLESAAGCSPAARRSGRRGRRRRRRDVRSSRRCPRLSSASGLASSSGAEGSRRGHAAFLGAEPVKTSTSSSQSAGILEVGLDLR